jgi:predicted TIM-barrel fold metal-dependent hydrolase
MLLASGERPLGNRGYWPIYEAAARHGLVIGIHAGSSYRHAPTPVGWPSFYTETYIAQASAFQSQLISLVCEGVFVRFPKLRVVLIESGITWLPAFLWRLTKFWRGLRMEVPWVDRAPDEMVRDHVRFTLQPFDAPPDVSTVNRVLDHLGSDDLILFSTDYPHWHFEGTDALPSGLSPLLARKMMVDNPFATYPRLTEVST